MRATQSEGKPGHRPGAVPDLPRTGEVLYLTRDASVQFAAPIYFRVIRVHDWPSYHGWIWLDGYQLDEEGDAIQRRSIFVRTGGLQRAAHPPGAAGDGARAGPAA